MLGLQWVVGFPRTTPIACTKVGISPTSSAYGSLASRGAEEKVTGATVGQSAPPLFRFLAFCYFLPFLP